LNKIVIEHVRLLARRAHTYIYAYSPCYNSGQLRRLQQNRIVQQQLLLFKECYKNSFARTAVPSTLTEGFCHPFYVSKKRRQHKTLTKSY